MTTKNPSSSESVALMVEFDNVQNQLANLTAFDNRLKEEIRQSEAAHNELTSLNEAQLDANFRQRRLLRAQVQNLQELLGKIVVGA